MTPSSRFAEVMKECRQKKGLTHSQLASKVGAVRSHVNDLEYGCRKPEFNIALKIAKVLDIDLNLIRDEVQLWEKK